MKYFTDQNLTDEILNDTLLLGTVPGGETKQFTIWALNNYKTFIKDLKFSIAHSEVKIIKAPETMIADDRQKIVFTWSPSITLEEGIEVTLEMIGQKIWG